MTDLRDYDQWHRHHDDPDSDLSWRLRRVQAHLADALDRRQGARDRAGRMVRASARQRHALQNLTPAAPAGRDTPTTGAAGVRFRRATLLWSRGLDGSDRNDRIRARLAGLTFTELDYATSGGADAAALSVVRYDGPPVELRPGQPPFSVRR